MLVMSSPTASHWLWWLLCVSVLPTHSGTSLASARNETWCLSTHDKTVRQSFQNENKMSKNSGEFISCKINQIWTFSEPKRYKTGPINKTQLFRVFIHNKMFSYITTAKRKPHNFFIAIILNKVCHFFLSLIFGTKIELYLKWSSKTQLAFLFSNGSFKSIQL